MRKLAIPLGVEWQLLVVNNACTDRTDDVIDRHSANLPLERLFEDRPGKSYAANLAIKHTRGDLLLWADDDVLVDSQWVCEYMKAFYAYPDAAFVGGSVEPWFAEEPPPWIVRNFHRIEGAYAVRRLDPQPHHMEAGEFPVGANMAFRGHVARQYPFNTKLGFVDGVRIGGEDSDVIERMTADGHRGVWAGQARVRHYIPAERLTTNYLRTLYHGNGRSFVRQRGILSGPQMWGAPRWAWRKYLQAQLTSWILNPVKNERWLQALIDAALTGGIIEESRNLQRAEMSVQ
jgi:glycosyltransferase involved in cell wall biosynthesis